MSHNCWDLAVYTQNSDPQPHLATDGRAIVSISNHRTPSSSSYDCEKYHPNYLNHLSKKHWPGCSYKGFKVPWEHQLPRTDRELPCFRYPNYCSLGTLKSNLKRMIWWMVQQARSSCISYVEFYLVMVGHGTDNHLHSVGYYCRMHWPQVHW